MRPDLPPGIGPYEQWPGYKRLKQRLEAFLKVAAQSQNGWVDLDVLPLGQSPWTVHRLPIKALELVIPSNKAEFEQAGQHIRIAFSPKHKHTREFLAKGIEGDFTKHGVGRITLWANTGPSNNVAAVYNAMILNKSRPEIYLQRLEDARYEIGLDAHGNLFDVLLLSDELPRT